MAVFRAVRGRACVRGGGNCWLGLSLSHAGHRRLARLVVCAAACSSIGAVAPGTYRSPTGRRAGADEGVGGRMYGQSVCVRWKVMAPAGYDAQVSRHRYARQ